MADQSSGNRFKKHNKIPRQFRRRRRRGRGQGNSPTGGHIIHIPVIMMWHAAVLPDLVLNFIPFKVEWSGKWHDKFDKSRFSHHLFAGNCDPVSKNLIRLQLIRLLELIIYVLSTRV